MGSEMCIRDSFKRDWTPEHIPEGCPPSSSVQLRFESTPVNPSPIKFNWTDGGIRPFHPDIIPASDDLGGSGSNNGVLIIGDKGVMTCATYGSTPKLYSYDGQVLEMDPNLSPIIRMQTCQNGAIIMHGLRHARRALEATSTYRSLHHLIILVQ